MSKKVNRMDKEVSGQAELFDIELSEGALDVSLGFKQGLSRAITASGKDRYQIAADISRLIQRDLSKEMLDKYCSSDPAYRFPAEALTAFCYVVGSLTPFTYLLEPLNSDVLNPLDRDLIEMARLQERAREIDSKIMQIRVRRGLK